MDHVAYVLEHVVPQPLTAGQLAALAAALRGVDDLLEAQRRLDRVLVVLADALEAEWQRIRALSYRCSA